MNKSKHFPFQGTMSMRGSAGKVDIYHNDKYFGDREIPVGYYQLHKKALYHRDKLVNEVLDIFNHLIGQSLHCCGTCPCDMWCKNKVWP